MYNVFLCYKREDIIWLKKRVKYFSAQEGKFCFLTWYFRGGSFKLPYTASVRNSFGKKYFNGTIDLLMACC